MATRARAYSRLTTEALGLLARQIKLARKTRGMSERELADRAGIARSTLQLIEKGDPSMEIGLVFETAVVLGINIFVPSGASLQTHIETLDDKLTLLPKSERRPRGPVKDDF